MPKGISIIRAANGTLYDLFHCHFPFEQSGEVECFPDCGKEDIRFANEEELIEFENRKLNLGMKMPANEFLLNGWLSAYAAQKVQLDRR